MTRPKGGPGWTPERALLRDLMDAFLDVPKRRTSAARNASRGRGAASMPMEPAPRNAPIEKVVPVELAPKVELVLAQASKVQGVTRRGRGVGRRFTKVTAVGAAVARAQHLPPERRREIALAASAARWGRA